ncbi:MULTISPECIES: hypothetical protein [Serratia]|uniref:hypothetical protein n=1 Tax=Serratia TaxID=613 RepID=UPI000C17AB6E|nr:MULTISPECIES: hypothetical protein [Serratia]EIV2911327.1 hypothetical protein [Serratia marcescens]EIV2915694.1 hypothetical protein [Serratia marcescens]MDH7588311.1 hypothetical protein [Serratia bockelmannii]PIJ08856.1 hypothetical protein BVV00_13525 [Serratia sp. OMLW3]PIJ15211.1 hypothetical protein BVU99_13870 [Serratia sp. OLAL2]
MANSEARIFIAKPFSYFDLKGECCFPGSELIQSNAREGIVTALVLDANICLNLANYARGQKDPIKESMFRQFLLAVEFVKVDVVPYFGCMELASNRESDQLDTDKLSSIASNVARALAQSEDSLARGRQASARIADGLEMTDKSLSVAFPMLRYAYCCFLKIFEIRSRGFLKARAAKNFIEFFDWCEAMECHIGLISQAAFALFGGAKEADKLLSLREGKTPLDAAWGAAWDIWHCWMVQNYFPALPVDGKPQHAIFVTDDAAAAFIAGQCLPRALFLNAGEPFLSASVLSYNFPFYADKGERLNELLRQRDSQRLRRILSNVSNTNEFDHARVQVEIERLEQAIMTSW